jgi:2-keto-3-deoxy-L-rhamnonate aldolase RhmA
VSTSPATLRDALRADGGLVATFVLIPRVEIIEMAGRAGFEAVVLDLEHGPLAVADLPGVAAAARGAHVYSIARVPERSPSGIAAALDAGVDGVLVPHVASVEDARAVVFAGRFPPRGERSLNPYVRGLGYGQELDRGSLAAADDTIAVLVMLEGADALDELESICAVPGLDGVFVGPVDLSASLGHPGEPEHPAVVDAVREAIRRVRSLGAVAGVYAPTADAAGRWLIAGASLVAVSADTAMTLRAFAGMRAAVTEHRGTSTNETPA